MTDIKALQDLINREIEKLHFGDEPKELYEPISYILSLGGKRLRPLLVFLGYLLEKKDAETILKPALSVEVFHNFTLIHDDIMDEAPIRRGKPTVHEKWNKMVAILSGDTMLVKAYDLLLDVDSKVLPDVIHRFNKCAVKVCEGQQIDINFETSDGVDVEAYINMIRLKTAVLLGFSLELGALIAGMDEVERRQLYQVGVTMGIGFQLMDDLLDVYGDQAKFGKQVGGDIVANKKTYLLIKALELADQPQKEQLNALLQRNDIPAEEKIGKMTRIYDSLGIKELTTQKMNEYFDVSFALLDSIKARDEGKKALRTFANQLMNRDN